MQKNTELILVTHALTLWNKQGRIQGHVDTPLCRQGRYMAQCLASCLAEQRIEAIYSSDLRRTLQTASPVAQAKGLVIQTEPKLREGRSKRQETSDEYPLLPFGVETETEKDVLDRMLEVMHGIAAKHCNQQVLVVSHAGAVELFINKILEMSKQSFLLFKNTRTALNKFIHNDGFWYCVQLDDAGHLRREYNVCKNHWHLR